MRQKSNPVKFQNTFTKKNKLKRFTLIEVLVVVAIIGILASLLLPSLSKARKSAHRSVCVNNLKNISSALLMYPDDNDSYFTVADGFGAHVTQTWDDTLGLGGYDGRNLQVAAVSSNITEADGSKIYYCPSSEFSYLNAAGFPLRTYRVNTSLMWRINQPRNFAGLTFGSVISSNKGSVQINEVGSPSSTVMISEYIAARNQGHRASSHSWYVYDLLTHTTHEKSSYGIIGFADGSVRHTSIQSTSLTAAGSEEMWDLD